MTAPGAGLGDGHGTIDRKKAAGTIDRKVAKQDAAKRAQVISLNVSFKQFIHSLDIKPSSHHLVFPDIIQLWREQQRQYPGVQRGRDQGDYREERNLVRKRNFYLKKEVDQSWEEIAKGASSAKKVKG